jgi:hypothetical protein
MFAIDLAALAHQIHRAELAAAAVAVFALAVAVGQPDIRVAQDFLMGMQQVSNSVGQITQQLIVGFKEAGLSVPTKVDTTKLFQSSGQTPDALLEYSDELESAMRGQSTPRIHELQMTNAFLRDQLFRMRALMEQISNYIDGNCATVQVCAQKVRDIQRNISLPIVGAAVERRSFRSLVPLLLAGLFAFLCAKVAQVSCLGAITADEVVAYRVASPLFLGRYDATIPSGHRIPLVLHRVAREPGRIALCAAAIIAVVLNQSDSRWIDFTSWVRTAGPVPVSAATLAVALSFVYMTLSVRLAQLHDSVVQIGTPKATQSGGRFNPPIAPTTTPTGGDDDNDDEP